MNDQRSPEHVVLAAILRDNAVYHHAVNVIDGLDFADARLGGVFDGMCRHIAAGGKVDAMDVAFYFPEWGVVGVGPEEPWVWLDSCFMPSEIIRATEIVKAQSLRRTGQAAFRQGLEDLNDYSKSPAEVIENVNRAIVAKPRHSLQTVTLNDVLATPDTEDWVIPGLMERKDRLILTGHEGLGKALDVQTPILTTAGWKTMGTLHVGDYVYGRDGKPTRVTFATGIQYDRDCYLVTFSDGAQIIADADHLWETENYYERQATARLARRGETKSRGTDQRSKMPRPKVRTTREIADTLHARGGHTLNHSIEVCQPLEGLTIDFNVSPYILGAWLGDGTTADGHFTIGDADAGWFTRKFEAEGWPVHATRAPLRHSAYGLRVALREAGVLGDKHIPDVYLGASREQRLALLQGLMDTDGTISQGEAPVCEFSVMSERLALDVWSLVTSLGIKATFSEGTASIQGRVVGTRYRIRFQTDLPVFALPRKAGRVRPLRTRRSRLRYITNVEPIDSVPVRCIQVDSPDHLYLAGRALVPTHNTTMVRQMLILPAAGIHPFTNERIEPVKALVIDAENTAKQWMRAARWFVQRAQTSYGADPGSRIHMALSGRVNILDPSTLGGIHRLIDQHKPDVVFLGPLYRLAVHMNSDEQIAPVIAALDTIRDRDVALIIEAHAGHAVGVNGVRDVRPRGSSALLGWPEFGFGIRKDVSVDANANAFEFVAWRGAREQRDWPERLIRGDWSLGDWPWVSVPNY